MRLNLLLPDVKPEQWQQPKQCGKKECKGKCFYPRQAVEKKIVDGKYQKVRVWRYECARCGCTFRVYPQGVGRQQISHRVIGLAVMLYVLGLSYGAVGADVTSVRCIGKWLPCMAGESVILNMNHVIATCGKQSLFWRGDCFVARLSAGCDMGEHAVSLGVTSKTYGLAGLRIGWIATRNRKIFERMAALKDYTTICNSALSEFLAEVAMRNRQKLIDHNLGIIKHNLSVIDDLFSRHVDLLKWIRPQAGSMGFPRLLKGDIETFCDNLVRKAGVLLLPGTMYDDAQNHFRLGLGRKNLPQAVERLEEYLSRSK